MDEKHFTTDQILEVIKMHNCGVSTARIVSSLGISEFTLYKWKQQYGNLSEMQLKKISELRKHGENLVELTDYLNNLKSMLLKLKDEIRS